ncbi:MAG: MMPL family transporter [Thermotogae bacterium]|nr:MMPL family transporter [Thermotogota bacterium]
MNKFYKNLSKFVIKYSKIIIIATAVCTAVFGYMASKIGINSNILSIMPENDPILIDYNTEQKSQNNEVMLIAVFLNENSDPYKIASELNTELSKKEYFSGFVKTDISFLLSYGLVYIGDTDVIKNISKNVNDLMDSLKRANPYDFKTFEYINSTLENIYKLQDSMGQDQTENILKSYYAVSQDQKVMVMGSTYNGSSSDVGFVNKIIPDIKKIIDKIGKKNNVKIGLTGNYIMTYESNKSVSKDFQFTTVMSIILIIIIFFISFGNIKVTFIALFGLISATLISMGITQIIYTNLNMITSFVMAITLGLGIDYGIHITTRLLNEYIEKNDFEEALSVTYEGAFLPLIFGALTTITVFMSLLLMKMPGFTQMGVISSIGLIVFFIIMTIFIPAAIYQIRGSIKNSILVEKINHYFKLLGKFIPKNGPLLRNIILPVTIILSVIGFYNAINFSYTPSGLVDNKSEYVVLGNQVAEKFGGNPFDSLEYILKIDDDIDKTTFDILSTGVVQKIESLPDQIEESLGEFNDLKSKINDLSQIVKNPVVVSILKKYNMYSESLKLIEITSKSKDLYQFSMNVLEILPEELRKSFIIEQNNQKYMLLKLKPSYDSIWKDNNLKYFFEKLGPLGENVIGLSKAMYKIMKIINDRFIIPIIFSFAFITLLTFISRKNIFEALETFIGLLISILSTFGIAYMFNIRSTFLTVLAFPLIFGIGADGFIHIFHSIDEDKTHYWHTLKSVSLSFLTTIAAFINFQFSKGDLLKEFSFIMIIGIAMTWIFTVIMIPAYRHKKLKNLYENNNNELSENENTENENRI